MDALKNIAGGNNNNKSEQKPSSDTNPSPNAQAQPQASGQKDDYGDKGAQFLNKKYLGDKLSKDQLEKITDTGRETLEKATGKKVPEKFSN